MERRIFGQLPQTVELALANLPDERHPSLGEDESLQHLNALRRIIEQSILHYSFGVPFPSRIFPPSDLEERMVPLTQEDVRRMGELSFRRGKLVGVLPFLAPDADERKVWEALFSPREMQPWINVWEMIPWAIEKFPLVLIEEHEPEDQEFPFTMGVVIPAEYASLTRELRLEIYNMVRERNQAKY